MWLTMLPHIFIRKCSFIYHLFTTYKELCSYILWRSQIMLSYKVYEYIYVLVFQLVATCVASIQAWLLQSDAVLIVRESSSAYLLVYTCMYVFILITTANKFTSVRIWIQEFLLHTLLLLTHTLVLLQPLCSKLLELQLPCSAQYQQRYANIFWLITLQY